MRLHIEDNVLYAGRVALDRIEPNRVAAALIAQGRHPILARILAFGGQVNALEALRIGEAIGLLTKGAAK